MKQIIVLVSVCLSSVLCACSDDNWPALPAEDACGGSRSVTFALSRSEEGDFSVATKAQGTLVPGDYAVKFYLFEENTESSQYELVKIDDVTGPLYTLEGLNEEGSYKYVFVSTPIVHQAVLEAIDFSSTEMLSPNAVAFSRTKASAAEGNRSILENCYISFFDDETKSIPDYGYNAASGETRDETIPVTRDLAIFGCGNYILPGMTFYTPIRAVMERQFGIVEFRYADAQEGDILTCSFSSDYYRLYLSQMVKVLTNGYMSDNSAPIPGQDIEGTDILHNPFEYFFSVPYAAGDYYSALGGFQTGGVRTLPVFTKTSAPLTTGESSVQVYMPYTTAEAVGTAVADKYKANYIRTDYDFGEGSVLGPKGKISLTVSRDGVNLKTYQLENADALFPIYRNGKTVFKTVGADYIEVNFGTAAAGSTGGIHLDEDTWHGDN